MVDFSHVTDVLLEGADIIRIQDSDTLETLWEKQAEYKPFLCFLPEVNTSIYAHTDEPESPNLCELYYGNSEEKQETFWFDGWHNYDSEPAFVTANTPFYVRNNAGWSQMYKKFFFSWPLNKKIAVSGYLYSMHENEWRGWTDKRYGFYEMFKDCGLSSVRGLIFPKDGDKYVVSEEIFRSMFENTRLTTFDTKLVIGDYEEFPWDACRNMFTSCSELVDASNIKIEHVHQDTCTEMFSYCTSLKVPPTIDISRELDSDLSTACDRMFEGCSSLKVNTSGKGKLFCYVPKFTGVLGVDAFKNTGGSYKGDLVGGVKYYYEV